MKFYCSLLLLAITVLFFSCGKDIAPNELNVDGVVSVARTEISINSNNYASDGLGLDEKLFVYLDKVIGEEQSILNNDINVKIKSEFQKIIIKRKIDDQTVSNFNYSINSTKDTIEIDFTEILEASREYKLEVIFRYLKFSDNKWEYLKKDRDQTLEDTIQKEFMTKEFGSHIFRVDVSTIGLLKDIFLENEIFPKVQLNYPVDREFVATKDGHGLSLVRARIKDVNITSNGNSLEVEQSWNSDYEFKVLPMQEYTEQTNYKCNVLVEFEEKVDGEWLALTNSESTVLKEEKSIEFTVGSLENESSIGRYLDATYPLDRQMNFYPKEYDRGYFQFVMYPKNIASVDVNNIVFKFFSLPDQIEVSSISAVVNSGDKTIWFDLPQNLENDKIYQIKMLSNSKELYSYEFRVSKFDRFNEKLPDELKISFLDSSDDGNGLSLSDNLGCKVYYDEESREGLDFYEIFGLNDIPLVQISAVLEKWDWYQTSVYKYIYDNYPIIPEAKLTRDMSEVGNPPVNPIVIRQLNDNRRLSDEEVEAGAVTYFDKHFLIVNMLPEYWKLDYIETRKAMLEKYDNVEEISDELHKRIYSKFYGPRASAGNYPVLFEYKLPGKNIITSTKEISIINEFEIRNYWLED
ncbi:hypothetical protein [Labilibaculum euxinus]|uniref:DUF4249 family protein n=1 Tax=Labilibaculum euxinus TaxID=2686357 RepID=A0A7M4DBQ8_9BACT|nr:hypothetical protein [Labilibaculum euxinus]MUP40087.1 hypothetical protein [Labilibaculum euxinus]MVB09292.1 hypothetical protein [Labilibaculum euxinus]